MLYITSKLLLLFYTLGRYIPEGFKKITGEKLTNRYDTQSMQSNTGKQSWSRTALKRCNITEILWKRKHVSLASPETDYYYYYFSTLGSIDAEGYMMMQ